MAKEIFLLVNDEYENIATEVTRFKDLDELNMQLSIDSYGNLEDDVKIYHGMLIPATFIPRTFNASTPYIYIPNPLGHTCVTASREAHFEKVKGDPETVAMMIEELIKERTFDFDNRNCPVTINDVFLFFGHQLQKVFQVLEDQLDEEVMDRVTELTDSIFNQNKQLEEDKHETQS